VFDQCWRYPTTQCACSMCPRRFRQKSHVALHERTHTGDLVLTFGQLLGVFRALFPRFPDLTTDPLPSTSPTDMGSPHTRESQHADVPVTERPRIANTGNGGGGVRVCEGHSSFGGGAGVTADCGIASDSCDTSYHIPTQRRKATAIAELPLLGQGLVQMTIRSEQTSNVDEYSVVLFNK